MFALYHSSGFYYASVTKGVLGSLVLSSIALNIQPLAHYRPWLAWPPSAELTASDLMQYVGCRLVFLDPKDVLCASFLLYHFRIFERRFGSQKFASRLLCTFLLSLALELASVYLCQFLPIQLDPLPTGPYGMVFALFVPYFCDVPRVAMTSVMGIPFTGKSLNYIVGLQMASSSAESLLLSLCGLVAGLLHRANVLYMQQWVCVPGWLAWLFSCTLGHLVVASKPPSGDGIGLGATLEIQRQQHLDRLERQMALAQLQQQHRPIFGFLNRNANGIPGFGNFAPNANIVAPAVSEDQVQRLVEMGFNRDRVLDALRSTNNDISMATSILLTQS